ncbi:DUF1217 domain-containing protein [Paracoccus gahaiensis]|uniref:DUF1217 domain-containing protein n=2 Tax=Paracoccus gahaiensis TaxID=1706839 RepID=A0A4U0RB55_9RHOB|nr:DUF1217 domain-containing protein [Paracoccus gahaiensis]
MRPPPRLNPIPIRRCASCAIFCRARPVFSLPATNEGVMTISVGATGLVGWKIVQRIEARQIQAVARDPVVQRATTYFRDTISRTTQAEDLVKDYRMLSTALSAFGLEADLPNKAFIRKVLESDVSDRSSLVNRLADKRYLRLAEAFGFGAKAVPGDLGETVSTAFVQREFERRIGEGDDSLRLGLNARRELQRMGERDSTDRTLWFEVIGNAPLRKVFQGAFGFSESYGRLPIDRQLEEYTKASERLLGSSSFKDISSPEAIDRLVQTYMARSQLATFPAANRYSAALTLLQNA